MLVRHVRHFPNYARTTINEIIGEAEQRFDLPRQVTIRPCAPRSRWTAAWTTPLEAYLKLVLPPEPAS